MFEPAEKIKKDVGEESARHTDGPKQITLEMLEDFRKTTGFKRTNEEAEKELSRKIREAIKKETQ